MKILIIEDEPLAEEYLVKQLGKTAFDIDIAGKANSVKNGIKWLLKNPHPDLIFTDIDLGDGLCFEIFEVIDVSCPIIFTTAYDQYAIKAFKVNGIDYLLKPVDEQELEKALKKFTLFKQQGNSDLPDMQKTGRMFTDGYKQRFIVKIGDRLKAIPVREIMYFTSREKASYACTEDKRNYLVDYTLDRLNEILDPARFFRINRKYIVCFEGIKDIIAYTNSRLKIKIAACDDDNIIVARDRVGDFKAWLDR